MISLYLFDTTESHLAHVSGSKWSFNRDPF